MSDIASAAVYLFCAVVSAACAFLLVRSYRRYRSGLLLWSTTCFSLLSVHSMVVFVDLTLVDAPILQVPRLIILDLAGVAMVFGMIWGEEE